MKALKMAMKSYLWQPWPMGFLFYSSMIIYFIFLVLYLTNVDFLYENANIPFIGFVFSIMMLSSFVGVNLRRIIQSPTSLLMPKYRHTQLKAGIFYLLPFVLLSTILMAIKGFSFMTYFTAFVFVAVSVTIMLYRFSEQLVLIILLMWIMKFGLQMLGFNIGHEIWSMTALTIYGSKFLFELAFLFICIIAAYWFYRYYLNVSIQKKYIAKHTDDGWNRNHETGSKFQIYLINKIKERMIKKSRKIKDNDLYQIRLIQYSLFSPFILSLTTILIYCFYIFAYTFTWLWFFYDSTDSSLLSLIINMTFMIFIIILMSDFLNHRNRISLLWLQSRTKSKTKYLKLVFSSVMYNVAKYYIMISLIYITALLLIGYSSNQILASLLFGMNFYLGIPALAFIFNDRIESEGSKGWNAVIMFSSILILNIGNGIIMNAGEHLTEVIIALLAMTIVTSGLLIIGYRRWLKTDLALPGLP